MTHADPAKSGHGLDHVWAKSPASDRTEGEGLVEHTRSVIRALGRLAAVHSDLPDRLGEPRLWHRLYWAAFIHDWGKAALGFQAQVRPGGGVWGKRHEVLSLAFVDLVSDRDNGDWTWVAAAIASHHLDEPELRKRYNVATGDPAHLAAVQALAVEMPDDETMHAMLAWLCRCGSDWAIRHAIPGVGPLRLPLLGTEALRDCAVDSISTGLRAFYSWSHAVADRFPADSVELGPLMLRGLMISADHSGSAHRPDFTRAPLPPAWKMLAEHRARWGAVRDHQAACAAATGNVVLSAPTGSGKTEAAVLWAANQTNGRGDPPPRLFYVLPFQASINAMYDRLSNWFGEQNVALAHSKAKQALYHRYLARTEDAARAAWATRAATDLTRLLVPPIRVVTPYQLLKAAYRLPGYECVLADMHGACFIWDEIHAYETKRLAMMTSLMGFLSREMNASSCFMSATFPDALLNRLREAVGGLAHIQASAATLAEFRRHRVVLCDGDLQSVAGVDAVVASASAGCAVLVCCNTVSRAQQMRELLHQRGVRAELMHSRFTADDRLKKEAALREAVGSTSSRPDARIVLVATQVVEVSLDVDFDVLYTDPAPLDALLQRFGRVNRARRAALRDVFVFTQPVDGRPYGPSVVEVTLGVLRREFGAVGAPLREEHVSAWLNEVYSGDWAAATHEEYLAAQMEFQEAALGSLYAFASSPELEDVFYEAFDAVEVLPACFRDEYVWRQDSKPLEADGLLVPVSGRQYARLRRTGRVVETLKRTWARVVDVPYSSDVGLLL